VYPEQVNRWLSRSGCRVPRDTNRTWFNMRRTSLTFTRQNTSETSEWQKRPLLRLASARWTG